MPHKAIVVLVVEDEFFVRSALVDFLEDAGFEVREASDADDAMSQLTRSPGTNALFTDIDMPGSMDGLELAAAVHKRWPPIKIIVTSGVHSVDASDIPDDGLFLSKPYVFAEVATSLRGMRDTAEQ